MPTDSTPANQATIQPPTTTIWNKPNTCADRCGCMITASKGSRRAKLHSEASRRAIVGPRHRPSKGANSNLSAFSKQCCLRATAATSAPGSRIYRPDDVSAPRADQASLAQRYVGERPLKLRQTASCTIVADLI